MWERDIGKTFHDSMWGISRCATGPGLGKPHGRGPPGWLETKWNNHETWSRIICWLFCLLNVFTPCLWLFRFEFMAIWAGYFEWIAHRCSQVGHDLGIGRLEFGFRLAGGTPTDYGSIGRAQQRVMTCSQSSWLFTGIKKLLMQLTCVCVGGMVAVSFAATTLASDFWIFWDFKSIVWWMKYDEIWAARLRFTDGLWPCLLLFLAGGFWMVLDREEASRLRISAQVHPRIPKSKLLVFPGTWCCISNGPATWGVSDWIRFHAKIDVSMNWIDVDSRWVKPHPHGTRVLSAKRVIQVRRVLLRPGSFVSKR